MATPTAPSSELEKLRAENEALKHAQSQAGKPISFKIGEKGGLSVYGLGRFPVTLYKEQWLKLLGASDAIKDFLAKNDDRLKTKD
jgi:hypothetical protein